MSDAAEHAVQELLAAFGRFGRWAATHPVHLSPPAVPTGAGARRAAPRAANQGLGLVSLTSNLSAALSYNCAAPRSDT